MIFYQKDGQYYGYASTQNITYPGILSGIQTSLSPFAATAAQCAASCTAPSQYNGCNAWAFINNACYYFSSIGTNFCKTKDLKVSFNLPYFLELYPMG
jgi:hypothetical protein